MKKFTIKITPFSYKPSYSVPFQVPVYYNVNQSKPIGICTVTKSGSDFLGLIELDQEVNPELYVMYCHDDTQNVSFALSGILLADKFDPNKPSYKIKDKIV